MRLKRIDLNGFKSFGRSSSIVFDTAITGVVGPNGSGKSNVVEAVRFALGEQSIKSMRGGQSTDFLFKSGSTGRGVSRASVSLIFDNSDGIFKLESLGEGIAVTTEEVVISREVLSDGAQKYSINGATVRMRDVVELIGSVNIGSSGHHIISQGEADRFLFSSPKERRQLLEEALGLRIYHYRIAETERKLEKSRNALREAHLLKKELEPHVKFLRKQIEKVEKSKELRDSLYEAYHTVLSPLESIISHWSKSIAENKTQLQEQIEDFRKKHSEKKSQLLVLQQSRSVPGESLLQKELDILRDKEHAMVREYSKYEMQAEHSARELTKLQQELQRVQSVKEVTTVSLYEVRATFNKIISLLQEGVFNAESIKSIHSIIADFEESVHSKPNTEQVMKIQNQIADVSRELEMVRADVLTKGELLKKVQQEMKEFEQKIRDEHTKELQSRSDEFEIERSLSEISQHISSAENQLALLEREYEEVSLLTSQFQSDIDEARGVFGDNFNPRKFEGVFSGRQEISNALHTLQNERRNLDRMKLRLEDLGVVSVEETQAEFEQAEHRYNELSSQITDIEHTIAELEPLLLRLQDEIKVTFRSGVHNINKQFGEFFVSMFGGGSAEIVVIDTPKRKKKNQEEDADEEDESEQGVDIRVKIPNKKQGDLSILSGGERSLTSIALLFSLSQVNPPPFIILDETDAALDEANSRRFGQLMTRLSEISQILVVTHNRETMGHCGRLYGVTLGQDSSSQLFSVKFEEAVKYAK